MRQAGPITSYRDDQGFETLLRHGQAACFEVRKMPCYGFLDALDRPLARPAFASAAWEARALGEPGSSLGADQQDLPQRIPPPSCLSFRRLGFLEADVRSSARDHAHLPRGSVPHP